MVISQTKLLDDMIKQQLKVSHLEKKIDCIVLDSAKANKSIKDKLGKELKDSDILIGLVEKETSAPKEENDAEKEDVDANVENTETEDKEEEVNESVKVQDLTS